MSQVTWSVAQNYCREISTDLAVILNQTDWLRLNKVAASKGLTTPAWVGLYNDVNGWRWSLYDLPLKNTTYSNWLSGQPDNYAGIESCAVIASYGVWGDFDCTLLKPFICYN
ncbi:macrophage mannose receptor 1-like isoform X6, partial [Clarias magur]